MPKSVHRKRRRADALESRAPLNPGTSSVSASDFKFISDNSQIESVREFLRLPPETLRS
jgi:hypothetical protein